MADRESLSLPGTTIARLIKAALPDSHGLNAESRAAVSKYTCLFILYIYHVANTQRLNTHKQTVRSEEILYALNATGFMSFIPETKNHVENIRDKVNEKKLSARARSMNNNMAADPLDNHLNGPNILDYLDGEDDDNELLPTTKRRRNEQYDDDDDE